MKAHLKDQAFALFIKHNSLRSIAKTLKVSRSTIERWSRSERWMEARERTHHQLAQVAVEQTIYNGADKLATAINILHDNIFEEASLWRLANKRGYSSKYKKKIINSLLSSSLAVSRLELHHLEYMKMQQRLTEVEIAKLEIESSTLSRRRYVDPNR